MSIEYYLKNSTFQQIYIYNEKYFLSDLTLKLLMILMIFRTKFDYLR
jgi:hypothetical protein